MKFSIGDKVILKSDDVKGSIVSINSAHRVTIITKDGFKLNVPSKELVKVISSEMTMKSYGENFPIKDVDINLTNKISKKNNFKDDRSILKVDLHKESLEIRGNFTNHEILLLQIDECHKAINNALNNKNIQTIEIIHGIGNGRLKEEVHNILNDYSLRYYIKNNGGCTEVFI